MVDFIIPRGLLGYRKEPIKPVVIRDNHKELQEFLNAERKRKPTIIERIFYSKAFDVVLRTVYYLLLISIIHDILDLIRRR